MKVSHLQALLKEYNSQKGWFRYFFGNTQGIKELQTLTNGFSKAKSDKDLSIKQLDKIKKLLADRAERLSNRDDNYLTNAGSKKLTNKIYQKLATQLNQSYQSHEVKPGNSFLMPHISNAMDSAGAPIDSLNLKKLHLFEEKGKTYALNPQNYMRTMTINQAWQNPHTGKALPKTTINYLFKHPIYGDLFKGFKNILKKISAKLWVGHDKVDNEWTLSSLNSAPNGTIYQSNIAKERLKSLINTITYHQLTTNFVVFDDLMEKDFNLAEYRNVFDRKKSLMLQINKAFGRTVPENIQHIPLEDVFFHKESQCGLSINAFLEQFNENDGQLTHPDHDTDLDFKTFLRLHSRISSLKHNTQLKTSVSAFLTTCKQFSLNNSKSNYETYLKVKTLNNKTNIAGDKSLFELPASKIFVSESNHGFDIDELLAQFKVSNGFQNPLTQTPFTEQDIKNLRKQRPVFKILEKFYNACAEKIWQSQASNEEWLIRDMRMTEDENVVFHYPDAVTYFELFMDDINFKDYQDDRNIILALLKIRSLPEDLRQQIQFSEIKYIALKTNHSENQSLISAPLKTIIISTDETQAFTVNAFAENYSTTQTFSSPTDSKLLSHNDFVRLIAQTELLNSDAQAETTSDVNTMLAVIKSLNLIEDKSAYDHYCSIQSLKNSAEEKEALLNIAPKALFITEDGYGFNIADLLSTITPKKKYTNPQTQTPLSELDIEKIAELANTAYSHIQSILTAIDAGSDLSEALNETPCIALHEINNHIISVPQSLAEDNALTQLGLSLGQSPLSFELFSQFAHIAESFASAEWTKQLSLPDDHNWQLEYQYQRYLLIHHDRDPDEKTDAFVLSNGEIINIETLLLDTDTNGFISPTDQSPLNEFDISCLTKHPRYGQLATEHSLKLQAWQQLEIKPELPSPSQLLNLYFLENGDCIDFEQSKDIHDYALKQYGDKNITLDELQFILSETIDMNSLKTNPEYISSIFNAFSNIIGQKLKSFKQIDKFYFVLSTLGYFKGKQSIYSTGQDIVLNHFATNYKKYYIRQTPKQMLTGKETELIARCMHQLLMVIVCALTKSKIEEFLELLSQVDYEDMNLNNMFHTLTKWAEEQEAEFDFTIDGLSPKGAAPMTSSELLRITTGASDYNDPRNLDQTNLKI